MLEVMTDPKTETKRAMTTMFMEHRETSPIGLFMSYRCHESRSQVNSLYDLPDEWPCPCRNDWCNGRMENSYKILVDNLTYEPSMTIRLLSMCQRPESQQDNYESAVYEFICKMEDNPDNSSDFQTGNRDGLDTDIICHLFQNNKRQYAVLKINTIWNVHVNYTLPRVFSVDNLERLLDRLHVEI